MKPARPWHESLAKSVHDPAFVREYFAACTDEGVNLHKALSTLVRAYGIQAFAKKIGMAPPNLLRAINPKHNPTQETINRLLAPFGLQLSVVPIPQKRKRAA